MKLKTLVGVNIYSYLKFEIDFLDYSGVTTIILGKNLDQKTANAAGKTSILKTLYWVLWNKELDGANIDSMINRVAGNGMYAILEFEDRGNHYKITRWKDYKTDANAPILQDGKTPIGGSGVEFLINDEPFNGESHAQTQKIIEGKLRMTPRLFLSAVLSAQDGNNHFLTANDTDKKELLSELLDLQAFQKAFDAIKKEIKTQEDTLASQEARVENLQEQIQNNVEQIEKFKESETAYETEKKEKLSHMSFEREALAKEGRELKELAAQKDPTKEVREELQRIQTQTLALKKEMDTEQKASDALTRAKAENDLLLPRKKELEDSSIQKTQEIQTITNDLEVSAPFDDSSLSLAQESLNESEALIKKLTSNLSLLKVKTGEKNTLKIQISGIDKELEQIEHEIKDVKDNAVCPSCQRKFQVGESSSLDELLKKIIISKNEKTEAKEKLQLKLESLDKEIQELSSSEESLHKEEENKVSLQKALKELQVQKQSFEVKEGQKKLKEERKNSLQLELEKIKEEILRLEKTKASNDTKISSLESLIEKLDPVKKQFEENQTKIQELQEKLVDGQSLAQRILDARRRLQEKVDAFNKNKKESDELESKPNPYTEIIQKLTDQQNTFKDRVKKHKEDILKIQEELKYLNFWRVGFAPTGIRSFITDDVIELLNRKTQENLNDLFDGALSVVFDPESKNQKGISSNKISTFFVLNGKETPFELLSGGEKRRAILATDLALTEIAEARAGTKLNVRFLDEPFNGIDDNGQIKSLVLFSRLAREKDGFFIISHEEKFQNLCQKAVYVIKEREVSRLVDRPVFMSVDIEKQDQTMEGTDSNNRLQGLLKKKRKDLDED